MGELQTTVTPQTYSLEAWKPVPSNIIRPLWTQLSVHYKTKKFQLGTEPLSFHWWKAGQECMCGRVGGEAEIRWFAEPIAGEAKWEEGTRDSRRRVRGPLLHKWMSTCHWQALLLKMTAITFSLQPLSSLLGLGYVFAHLRKHLAVCEAYHWEDVTWETNWSNNCKLWIEEAPFGLSTGAFFRTVCPWLEYWKQWSY